MDMMLTKRPTSQRNNNCKSFRSKNQSMKAIIFFLNINSLTQSISRYFLLNGMSKVFVKDEMEQIRMIRKIKRHW